MWMLPRYGQPLSPGTNMSTVQTFYSRSDVIPLLSPSVDRSREFDFNPGALWNHADAHSFTGYSNREVGLASFAISGSGRI